MNKTEQRAKELKDDPFIQKHLAIIKAKTLEAQKDVLIIEHIEKMWGGLEMASIQHFVETGKVSGSFYLALKTIMEEYANKAIAGATEAQDDWKRVEGGLPDYELTVDVYGIRRLSHPQMGGNPPQVTISRRIDTKGTAMHALRDRYVDKNGFAHMESVTHWRLRPSPPSNDKPKMKKRKCDDCGSVFISNERCPECNPLG